MVRRAQEMLANGDIKAARLLLLRAAEARERPRGSGTCEVTFDPIALRQLNTADPGPDVAQARKLVSKSAGVGRRRRPSVSLTRLAELLALRTDRVDSTALAALTA